MDKTVRNGIVHILQNNIRLLRIPVRQKAKFEGWLKFELAHYLEDIGMKSVKVESKVWLCRDRIDITFFHDGEPYSLELKTPNTNWKIEGINSNCRPITKNIQSIISDAIKLNSENGIVAFVLFPIPVADNRWEIYLDRINKKTNLGLNRHNNCELVNVDIDKGNVCSLMVCAFKSKRFRNWP